MQALWNHLISNNPMRLEGVRAGRRFLRTGGESGHAVNMTIIGILAFMYVWLLLSILHFREDVSQFLLYFELVLLTLVVPASLFGAVSAEREKMTWDSLVMTGLTPGQIIFGKLLWRVGAIVGIMGLVSVALLMSQAFFLHGTREYSNHAILLSQAVIFTWSLLIGAFSFFASAKTKRPITTLSILTVVLLSFLALLPLLIATFNGPSEWKFASYSPMEVFGTLLIHLNPFYEIRVLSYGLQADFVPPPDLWRTFGLITALPLVYLLASALFIAASCKTLRRLEAPRRTIG